MAISNDIKNKMKASSFIRKMFEAGTQLKKEYGADRVFDLSIGNPDVEPPEAFKKALVDVAASICPGKHAYMSNAGYSDVRKSVAEYVSKEQGVNLSCENVIMTCGAGGALNTIFKTILNPGDNIITTAPCFVEYKFYAENHGGSLEMVPVKNDFDLDIERMSEKISKKTAAVLINSPNNPTGKIYSRSTLNALGKMLERKSLEFKRTIYLLSDEPYRKIVFDGLVVPSVFTSYKNSIIATSYSKDLSIPGERIGYIALHPMAEDCGDLINGMILSNRILGYVNAPAIMQRVVGRLQGCSVDIAVYEKKRDILCRALSDMGYRLTKPGGTFYLFPHAPGGDDLEFVKILQKELVLTVPGTGFGAPGYFRIAFCRDMRTIEGSIAGFKRAISLF